MRDVTQLVPHLPCQESGAMPARASLPRRRPRRPSCVPAHAATFSLGAVGSGAARRGTGRDEIFAAARTVRATSAMARPQNSCNNSVTLANGSGRRRPRGTFSFGLPVGRTSPSCHAVRSPDRNCSSVEAEGSVALSTTGRSASATSSCWTSRMVFSNRTGSSVAYVAIAWRRTSSLVRASASNR